MKKSIAFLLVLCLLLLSVPVMAEENEPAEEAAAVEQEPEEVLTVSAEPEAPEENLELNFPAEGAIGGSCGTNVKWSYENGLLTLSGSGAMRDYSSISSVPWWLFRSLILRVQVEAGVTHIGSRAFSGCSNLSRVEFAGNAPTFGTDCFANDKITVSHSCQTFGWESLSTGPLSAALVWNTVHAAAPVTTVNKAPTAQEYGSLTYACPACVEPKQITIPKLDSVNYHYSVIKSADCTSEGLGCYSWNITAYGTLQFEETIPAKGHSFKDDVCTECGYTPDIEEGLLYGDLNGDHIVDALDRVALTRYLAKWSNYNVNTLNLRAADVNCDGLVDALDRIILSRYVANWGSVPKLPHIG